MARSTDFGRCSRALGFFWVPRATQVSRVVTVLHLAHILIIAVRPRYFNLFRIDDVATACIVHVATFAIHISSPTVLHTRRNIIRLFDSACVA